jgi:hypothetical protein
MLARPWRAERGMNGMRFAVVRPIRNLKSEIRNRAVLAVPTFPILGVFLCVHLLASA